MILMEDTDPRQMLGEGRRADRVQVHAKHSGSGESNLGQRYSLSKGLED